VAFLVPLSVAAIGAGLLSLGLPKANLAPLGLVGLTLIFWAWFGLSPRSAFWTGWISGILYFSATFGWFGETAGAYVAPFGFALVLLPAILEGFAFAIAGALVALAWTAGRRTVAPLAGAAAFAALEWLRSSGPLGLPFGNLAYAYVGTPLAALAAYVGSFGLTFVVCVIAAYVAYALRTWRDERASRTAATALLLVVVAATAAWAWWPARHAPRATVPVAAIQGNIAQSIKWTPGAFETANARYEALTRWAARGRPAFILWPETVVTTELNLDWGLLARIADLARQSNAELIVGAKELRPEGEYNSLYYFRPDGLANGTYRKQRLVPFVEQLPAEGVLGRLPGASLVSRFRSGTTTGIRTVDGLRIAPMICWESAFDGVAHSAVADGAQAFVIATDDAWFGRTAGPYQHAQIAQMRALETGAWIVRAAATGISGIIAPDGRYVQSAQLDHIAIVQGTIGPPARTLYASIGAIPVGLTLIALYGVGFIRRGSR
jgi:apolipoprotein N-acyltransferase